MTKYEALCYLCPPVVTLALIDAVVEAGDPVRLVTWLERVVEQKQKKGEVIPDEIMGWVKALECVSYHMCNQHSVGVTQLWRGRMAQINRGEHRAIDEVEIDWNELVELDPVAPMEQTKLIEVPERMVY